jgi:hypothetical protein
LHGEGRCTASASPAGQGAIETAPEHGFLRAVEFLEQCGTGRARQLWGTYTRGVPEARLTQEVKAALLRMAK